MELKVTDDSVLKNAEGKNVTVFDYEWLIDGMDNFIKYGIACFKKVCKVVC